MSLSKYDLIFPIGERCHIYNAFKKFYPELHLHIFDFLGAISLDIAYHSISTQFKDFMLKENLEVINNGDGQDYFVKDKTTQVRCSHLFKTCLPPSESIDRYYPLLERLMRSATQEIQNANKILFCHATNEFTYSVNELEKYSEAFRVLFPDKQIDFVFFTYDANRSDYKKIYDKNGVVIIEIAKPVVEEKDIYNMYCWSNEPVLHEAVKDYLGIK